MLTIKNLNFEKKNSIKDIINSNETSIKTSINKNKLNSNAILNEKTNLNSKSQDFQKIVENKIFEIANEIKEPLKVEIEEEDHYDYKARYVNILKTQNPIISFNEVINAKMQFSPSYVKLAGKRCQIIDSKQYSNKKTKSTTEVTPSSPKHLLNMSPSGSPDIKVVSLSQRDNDS